MSDPRGCLPDDVDVWLLDLQAALLARPIWPDAERYVFKLDGRSPERRGTLMEMSEYAKSWISEDYAEHLEERAPYKMLVEVESYRLFGTDKEWTHLIVYFASPDLMKSDRIGYGVTFVRLATDEFVCYEYAPLLADQHTVQLD